MPLLPLHGPTPSPTDDSCSRRVSGISTVFGSLGDTTMLRNLIAAVFVLVLAAGFTLADEVKGKVKSVDADKSTITVTVGDKDQTLSVSKDAKLSLGKKIKELKDIKEGTAVTLVTDNDKVTEIKPTETGIKATVKSVDADKSTITVTIDDKEKTLTVSKDAKLSLGKKVKELKDIEAGASVLLTMDKKEKDTVTAIKTNKEK
jgi:hypothetical protein